MEILTVGDLRKAIRKAKTVFMSNGSFMDGAPVRVVKSDLLWVLRGQDDSDEVSTFGEFQWDGIELSI